MTYEIEESDIAEVKNSNISSKVFSTSKIKSLMKTKKKNLLGTCLLQTDMIQIN